MLNRSNAKITLAPITSSGAGPLYSQIVEGVKRELTEGRLEPGDALPSFRVLAEELLVSVITVKRAYEELEQQGIIFRKQGLGTFISENGADRSREVKRDKAGSLLREALREGRESGMSNKELEAAVKQILQEGS
jgi:GntR family transcriptional regulator